VKKHPLSVSHTSISTLIGYILNLKHENIQPSSVIVRNKHMLCEGLSLHFFELSRCSYPRTSFAYRIRFITLLRRLLAIYVTKW